MSWRKRRTRKRRNGEAAVSGPFAETYWRLRRLARARRLFVLFDGDPAAPQLTFFDTIRGMPLLDYWPSSCIWAHSIRPWPNPARREDTSCTYPTEGRAVQLAKNIATQAAPRGSALAEDMPTRLDGPCGLRSRLGEWRWRQPLGPLLEASMSTVYAYYLGIPGRDQRALVDRFCAERGLVVSDIFEDEAGARDTAWLARPAGLEMAARLEQGDEVVVAGLESVFSSRRELLQCLRSLQERGIAVHFAAFTAKVPRPISLRGAVAGAMIGTIEAFAALDSRRRSESIREALRTRRIWGRRHTNYPPYGHQWQRCRGEQRLMPDPYERAIIAKIIAWRDQGQSWYRIAARLLRCRVVTAAGREWSPSRVRRAYLAATRGRSHPAT
jgi:DNA invertase Pin-like site-specific DNA recombinase